MRDENYYREKQFRSDQKAIPTLQQIHKSHEIKQKAMAMLYSFFTPARFMAPAMVEPETGTIRGHKRSPRARRMRRARHRSMMRNHA